MKITLPTFILFAFCSCASVSAQNTDSLKFKVNGFLRFDYWNDTRVTDEAIEGIFTLVPSAKLFDSYGNDLNNKPSANALAASSRIKLGITGTRVLGAAASGVFEADFTGASGSSRFRLRHAAITLGWTKSSLLVGSYWHQMTVPDAFPSVIALNTGAPFQCFSRSPQVTYNYKFTPSFQATASAAWESDYMSYGPNALTGLNELSYKYLKYTSIPDVTLHLRYTSSQFTFGVLGEVFWLQPRLFTISPTTPTDKKQTKMLIRSFSYQAYAKYTGNKLYVIGRAMMGQNLAHHYSVGGYGVTSIDDVTGKESYSNFNHFYTYINIGYGKTVKPSIFVGYLQNLGTTNEILGGSTNMYGRSLNVASMLRIAPNISWTINNMVLAAEVEYDNAEYGTIMPVSKGVFTDTYRVSNTRVLFIAQYNF